MARKELEVVEPESTSLALPNGIVIDTSNIDEVVQAIKDLDLLKTMVATARRTLVDIVLEERKRTGSAATMHVGRTKVEITVAKEIVWNMEELAKLQQAGLPESTYNELVVVTITEKVDARVAARIAKANPAYKAIIDGARTDHEKNPSVSVT